MPQVKCVYCEQKFDRGKIAYVQPKARRYGHASCYFKQRVIDATTPELEVIDPADVVECFVCKKHINKKTDKYKQIGKKFFHLECAEIEEKREKTDLEKLEIFIMSLFNIDYVSPRIKKQIQNYVNDYNFSYSGIQKSLEYFYVVKDNSLDKANGGIGIVPFVYNDAYNYYYSLWEAKQKNLNIDIEKYKPRLKEITIEPPQRKIKRKKMFTFLDMEE